MQTSGQYSVPPEVAQYMARRGPPSHIHMFSPSDQVPLSPPPHGYTHHGHSPQQQQQLIHYHSHHEQPLHQQQHGDPQPASPPLQTPQLNQVIIPPRYGPNIPQQHEMAQELGLRPDSPDKAPTSPIAFRLPPSNLKNTVANVTDQSLAFEDQDGLGEEGDRGTPGTRWPRQETLALLKIRSDMDAAFRDSSVKGQLWEEISRKLSEMGYQRSTKKCKEKFENVHKYYKRTKEGKAGKQDRKNYRFFSQLEALQGNAYVSSKTGDSNAEAMFAGHGNRSSSVLGNNVVSARGSGTSKAQGYSSGSFLLASDTLGTRPVHGSGPVLEQATRSSNFSSESSDDEYVDQRQCEKNEMPGGRKRRRKSAGKLMVFFEKLLEKVMEKQEKMQQEFLEALERREQDRNIREEAWRRQEMSMMSRDDELREQERNMAATRDAALVTFLQKVTGQSVQLPSFAILAQPVQSAPPIDAPAHADDHSDQSSKRWPKPGVLALIKLRSELHPRFIEPGPKGALWEEISNGMSRLGYRRDAKRCKEKWENINKYFKKAKESNKQRPEDAKTCPYFHQLDALYRQGVLGGQQHVKELTYKAVNNDRPDEEGDLTLIRQHQQYQKEALSRRADYITLPLVQSTPVEAMNAVSASNVAALRLLLGPGAGNDPRALENVSIKPTRDAVDADPSEAASKLDISTGDKNQEQPE